MDAFDRTFGECDANGKCTLPASYLSILGGVIYAGFALGCSTTTPAKKPT